MARLRRAMLAAFLLTLTGCGIQGKWKFQTVTPEDARGQFQLGDVTFHTDGSYETIADYGSGATAGRGKYIYHDDKLTLTTGDGKTLEYDAEMEAMSSRLRVKKVMHGKEVVATFKRE